MAPRKISENFICHDQQVFVKHVCPFCRTFVAHKSRRFRFQKPWKSKDYFLNGFSVKTIALVRVYYQQILGNG